MLDRDTDKQDAKLLSHTPFSLSFVCVNDDAVNCASPVTSNNLSTDGRVGRERLYKTDAQSITNASHPLGLLVSLIVEHRSTI